MLVFIDTEFTCLTEPYLVSAALVTADNRELYFELVGVSPSICSSFVVENVLPLLHGQAITPAEAARHVERFFNEAAATVTLFCDAPRYDIELLKPFLPASLRWEIGVPSFEDEEEEAIYRMTYEAAFQAGLRRHHALDDAKAIRRAWCTVISRQHSFK